MDARAPAYAIIVCTRCRDPLTGASAASKLLARLEALEAPRGFRVETVACMAGCDRPLVVGFRATGKATYLFGDIEPDTDVEALRAFGELYLNLSDGWCSEHQRPAGLNGKIIARVPAKAHGAP